MPTFQYKKLVRDNIKKFHEDKGHTVFGKNLVGNDLRQALCVKLHEEADEVNDALSKEELIEEIADVQQILDDLCRIEGISEKELHDVQTAKANRKGGFLNGVYIETVTIPAEDDDWTKYCRERPDKYPEVSHD